MFSVSVVLDAGANPQCEIGSRNLPRTTFFSAQVRDDHRHTAARSATCERADVNPTAEVQIGGKEAVDLCQGRAVVEADARPLTWSGSRHEIGDAVPVHVTRRNAHAAGELGSERLEAAPGRSINAVEDLDASGADLIARNDLREAVAVQVAGRRHTAP